MKYVIIPHGVRYNKNVDGISERKTRAMNDYVLYRNKYITYHKIRFYVKAPAKFGDVLRKFTAILGLKNYHQEPRVQGKVKSDD